MIYLGVVSRMLQEMQNYWIFNNNQHSKNLYEGKVKSSHSSQQLMWNSGHAAIQ